MDGDYNRHSLVDRVARLTAVQEAVATVVSSHDDGCACMSCRAAAGDIDALMLVARLARDDRRNGEERRQHDRRQT
jgi:hypothetical protein